MRAAAVLMLLCFAVPASLADRVTVSVDPLGDEFLLGLAIDRVIDGELPLVKVHAARISLKDGKRSGTSSATVDDRIFLMRRVLDASGYFRLYRGSEGVGIYKYRFLPKPERPDGKGTWLRAEPLAEDDTFQELTRDARESADLENLMELEIDQASQAVEREERLRQRIERAIEHEWELLSREDAFLVMIRP